MKKESHILKTLQQDSGLRLSHKTTFDTICRHVRMSRPATPATQNDIEPVWFCSFPHRYSDATRKPENRNETYWNLKTSVSCETSFIFSHFVATKSTLSDEVFHELLKIEVGASSIFSTCHKMTRQPRNLHAVTT